MATPKSSPLIGNWGGDRLNLALSETGGTLTLDCASGTIAGPVNPDKAGHFKATGQWTQHTPGPDRADIAPASAPATIEGHITGPTLHLTVTHKGALQRFTLTEGKPAKLVRCL